MQLVALLKWHHHLSSLLLRIYPCFRNQRPPTQPKIFRYLGGRSAGRFMAPITQSGPFWAQKRCVLARNDFFVDSLKKIDISEQPKLQKQKISKIIKIITNPTPLPNIFTMKRRLLPT